MSNTVIDLKDVYEKALEIADRYPNVIYCRGSEEGCKYTRPSVQVSDKTISGCIVGVALQESYPDILPTLQKIDSHDVSVNSHSLFDILENTYSYIIQNLEYGILLQKLQGYQDQGISDWGLCKLSLLKYIENNPDWR